MDKQPFKVNGHEVDFDKIVPFTMGDWEDLKKQAGVDPAKIESNEQTIAFVTWALRRSNPAITEADVKTLGARIFGKLVAHIFELDKAKQSEVDFDFLEPPTL